MSIIVKLVDLEMNFFHLFTVFMVISSASDGEIYQNGIDANFSPSNFISTAYHLSVPLATRLTVTFLLILLQFTPEFLHTAALAQLFSLNLRLTTREVVVMAVIMSLVCNGLLVCDLCGKALSAGHIFSISTKLLCENPLSVVLWLFYSYINCINAGCKKMGFLVPLETTTYVTYDISVNHCS